MPYNVILYLEKYFTLFIVVEWVFNIKKIKVRMSKFQLILPLVLCREEGEVRSILFYVHVHIYIYNKVYNLAMY